jgi:hypothetical protein
MLAATCQRRFLSTPLKFLPTPFVFYRHRFLSTTYPIAVAFDSYRFLPLPQPVDAIFYRCCCYRHRLLSTPLAIDTACYRHRLLSTPLAIDTACYRHRLLSTPLVFDTACYRHRLLSTPLAIDTACFRHHLLSTPLAIDTACYHHRFLSLFLLPPFSTAIATTAILQEVALCHD